MTRSGEQPPLCQSCAMPLDEGHTELIAKNPDGSDAEYCTYCWADGHFIDPGLTIDQVIEIGVPHVMSFTGSEPAARQYLRQLVPRLKRWA